MDDSLDDSGGAVRLTPDVLAGVVETALAEALRVAAEAERWEIVAQLAETLAARRQTRHASRQVSIGSVADKRRARR